MFISWLCEGVWFNLNDLCLDLANTRSWVMIHFGKKPTRGPSARSSEQGYWYIGSVLCFFLGGFTEMDVWGRAHKESPWLNLHLFMDLSFWAFLCLLLNLSDEAKHYSCFAGEGRETKWFASLTWLASSRPGTLISFLWFTNQVLSDGPSCLYSMKTYTVYSGQVALCHESEGWTSPQLEPLEAELGRGEPWVLSACGEIRSAY